MNERFELPWDQLLNLINGRDINGYPLSASTLSIDEVSENKTITLKNTVMDEGTVTLHMSGGCVVAEISFDKKSRPQYEAARLLSESWMKDINESDRDDQMLSMTVVPVLMQGTFFLVLTDLTYAAGFEVENGYKLVLAFDNERTIPVVSDEINVESMIHEIDNEISRQMEEMRRIIAEAPPEEENENLYEKALQEQMSTITFEHESDTEEQQERRGMRVVKEKEDDPYV